jgi:hypothetical protein
MQILASGDLAGQSHADQSEALSLSPTGAGSLERVSGGVLVQIRVDGDEDSRAKDLAAAGADVVHVSYDYNTITATVRPADLNAISDVPGVEYVEEVITPMTGSAGLDAGPGAINTCATGTQSEGVAQLKANVARTQFDVDGTGVKVGILSDSFDTRAAANTHAAQDVTNADLPGAGNPCGRTNPVHVIQDDPGQADEGRAMLQIVHDVAPGADLAFATAFLGDTSFADNIRALANDGANIIADDIIYFREPIFQDGVIAKAINDVSAQGVSYFTMGYNSNRILGGQNANSWFAPAYRPTPCPAAVPAVGDCMDFDPGVGVDNMQGITVGGAGAQTRLNLDWAEPQFGVTTDFNFYLLTSGGALTGIQSTDNNATSGRPNEFISFTNGTNQNLVIQRVSGTGTPAMEWINPDNVGTSFTAVPEHYADGDTFGPTIYGHNGAPAAETVAAVPFSNSATVENFSARGPVTHYFQPINGTTPSAAISPPQVIDKPDVAATDGGQTSFFQPNGGVFRFFGTSAAAPHAAGVAALQLSANPSLTTSQIFDAQEATARAVGAQPHTAVGAGLIDAQAAIASKPPAPPPVSFTGGPTGTTNNNNPTFTFTVGAHPNTINCSIDGGVAQSCAAGSYAPGPQQDGQHTVAVTATDFFGQTNTATQAFSVDTTGPVAPTISKGPKKKSKTNKATFTFAGEAGGSFQCSLDNAAFAVCTSPVNLKVQKPKRKPRKHTFEIEQTDSLGNVGATATYNWTVKKKKKKHHHHHH